MVLMVPTWEVQVNMSRYWIEKLQSALHICRCKTCGYGRLTVLHLLYKGLEHLWMLVSVGPPGTNPLWILRDNWIRIGMHEHLGFVRFSVKENVFHVMW